MKEIFGVIGAVINMVVGVLVLMGVLPVIDLAWLYVISGGIVFLALIGAGLIALAQRSE